MIPKLETIDIRPVQLTAPEFTNRRRLDVSYEDIEQMMAGHTAGLRSAMISLKWLALSESGQDRVTIRTVRIVECSICAECGGFVDLFGESYLSEGVAERRYFHIECWNARQSEYTRLEDEDAR